MSVQFPFYIVQLIKNQFVMKKKWNIVGLLLAVFVAMMVLPMKEATGQQAYVVYDHGTLTFMYDSNKPNAAYKVEPKGWAGIESGIKKVVFDQSFKNYKPNSCASWFLGCKNLTEIVGMKENLNTTEVGNMSEMFSGCSSLTSLDLSGFNTANVVAMESMFSGCSGLTRLDLSNFNTAKVKYMGSMFYGCSGLTSLDLSSFNTANVTDMSYMFNNCSGLTSIGLSSFNTANATNMSSMFYNCSGLTSLDLSNFNTAKVKYMRLMFSGCSGLTSLDLSSFNTAKVSEMEGLFSTCSGLTSIDLSSFNTANVTDMSGMFWNCSSFTSLDVSGFNTANVTDMSGMFYGCSGLTSLDLSGFNTANVMNMSGMFRECSSLISLDLSSFNTRYVRNMYEMFYYCFRLQTIFVSDSWYNTSSVDCTYMFMACCSLYGGKGTAATNDADPSKYVKIDGGKTNPGFLTKIGEEPWKGKAAYTILQDSTLTFFYKTIEEEGFIMALGLGNRMNKSAIKKVVFDKSFLDYNPQNCSSWFSDCSNLSEIKGMENLNTNDVTNMSHMFYACSSLASLDLSGFNTASVTDMSYMFFGCSKLNTIFVGNDWNTDQVSSSFYMFYDCTALCGGAGTKYDQNYIGKNYARIDEGVFYPGYFTKFELAAITVSIEVSKLPETKYWEGDKLSLNGGVITVKYNNGESEDIDIAKAEVSGYDSNKAGEQVVTVKYLGKETSYKVYVTAKTAVYMEITKLPKTEYYEGEDLSFDGGVIYVKYNNGTSEEVALAKAATEGYYYHDETTHNVRVNYLGLEISYDVNIKAKYVVSISIYKSPKLSYLEGEELSRAGGVITVQYNNGTSENITFEEAELFGFDSYKLGSQYITVRYHNCETLYEITMHAKSAVSIEVTKLPDAGYHEGEELRLGGGVITVKYNNGTSEEIDIAKAEVWGYDTNKAGRQTIMVRYLGLETSYNVDVKAKQVVSIEITKNPKIDYIQGENLSLDGGMIGVTYDYKAYEEIALSSANISGYDPNKIGEQFVIVEYEGRQTKFTVTVSEKKEDNPNDPTPVSEVSANSAKIWSSDKTIYVQNPGKEIRIADMSGRLVKTVKTTADRMEIPMQKSGIYIVKTGAKTQKVMIQ